MTGPLAQQFAQVREALVRPYKAVKEPAFFALDELPEFEALSSIERHVQDMAERLEEFEHSLSNWEAAYPTSVFGDDLTKEEQRDVTDALVAAGFTSDRVHASWGRHIVRCFTEAFEPVRAALPVSGTPEGVAREKEEE